VARKGPLHVAFQSLFERPFGPQEVTAFVDQWQPLSPIHVDAAASRDNVGTLKTIGDVAAWTALGTAIAGVSATTWAWQTRRNASHASQRKRARDNDEISALNTVAVVSYALAAASGVAWFLQWIFDEQQPDATPVLGSESAALVLRF
jgi:hypothetical protein